MIAELKGLASKKNLHERMAYSGPPFVEDPDWKIAEGGGSSFSLRSAVPVTLPCLVFSFFPSPFSAFNSSPTPDALQFLLLSFFTRPLTPKPLLSLLFLSTATHLLSHSLFRSFSAPPSYPTVTSLSKLPPPPLSSQFLF